MIPEAAVKVTFLDKASTPAEVIRKAREHNITMTEAKRLLAAVARVEQKKATQ